MEDFENFSKQTYTLKQKHIDFLTKVNKNQSLALRTVLDSVIHGQEQKSKREIINSKINMITFGVFFIMLLFVVDSFYVRVFSLLMGISLIFMSMLSVVGGGKSYGTSKQ